MSINETAQKQHSNFSTSSTVRVISSYERVIGIDVKMQYKTSRYSTVGSFLKWMHSVS